MKKTPTTPEPEPTQVFEPSELNALAQSKAAPLDLLGAREFVRMSKASGDVRSSDPLVALLYLVARDALTTGTLEAAAGEALRGRATTWEFTNGWLASWAIDLATRLRAPAPAEGAK